MNEFTGSGRERDAPRPPEPADATGAPGSTVPAGPTGPSDAPAAPDPRDPRDAPRPPARPGPIDTPTRRTRIPTADDFPDTGPNALAGFGQRAWARSIDATFIYFPLFFTAFVYSVLAAGGSFDLNDPVTADPQAPRQSTLQLVPLWLIILLIALAVAYEVIAVAWTGQTIGKWVAGIRVARYVDGKKPTLEQAALRCLLPTLAGVATLVLFDVMPAGALMVLLTAYFFPLRRGWHDVAGGTVVVRTR